MKLALRHLLISGLTLLWGDALGAQQQFLNLDFEQASGRVQNQPWGWRRIPWGAVVGSVGLDTTTRHHGRQSLRLQRSSGRFIGFDLRLYSREAGIRGKDLLLTTWVRSDQLTAGDLRLRLSAGPSEDSVIVRQGTTAWEQRDLRITVPPDSGDVFLRFDLRGEGTVWLDHFELRVNGTLTDSAARGEAPSPEQQAWVDQHAIRLEAQGTSSGNVDLEPLLRMLRGARVIGLGESSHGTSEFQSTKRHVIERAVRELGVTVVALEESQLTTERLNRWIQGGSGELRALMADLYNMWRTEEMAGLFEWLRHYNATAGRRIEVIGIDAPNVNPELDSLLIMVPDMEPALAAGSATALLRTRAIWASREFEQPGFPRDSLAFWRRAAEEVLRGAEAGLSRGGPGMDRSRRERLVRYARAVVQGLMILAANGDDLAGRDSIMAANLLRELEARGREVRAVLSGHNGHVGRMPGRLGDHLARALGTGYVPVALTTFQGAYSALVLPNGQPPMRMAPVPLPQAFPGSIEALLHRRGGLGAVLDLRSARRPGSGASLVASVPINQIGILAEDIPQTRPFGDHWDIVLHLNITSATRFIPCPTSVRCWFPG